MNAGKVGVMSSELPPIITLNFNHKFDGFDAVGIAAFTCLGFMQGDYVYQTPLCSVCGHVDYFNPSTKAKVIHGWKFFGFVNYCHECVNRRNGE